MTFTPIGAARISNPTRRKTTSDNRSSMSSIRSTGITSSTQQVPFQFSLHLEARDGSFRKISVRVRTVKDAQVRAREGYQAPRS